MKEKKEKQEITSAEAVVKLRELFEIGPGGLSTEDNGTFRIRTVERTRTEAVKMVFAFAAEYDIRDGELAIVHDITDSTVTVFSVVPFTV